MVTPKLLLFILFLSASSFLKAQDDATYKMPPKDVADMLLAKPTPNISLDDKGEWLLFIESNSYPSVEELARPELRIAGLRINPANYGPSRQTFINNLYLKDLKAGKEYKIAGLPAPLYASAVSWSPDYKKIAFMHTTASRIDLYVIDIATKKAMKVNKTALNGLLGTYQWYDNNSLLYRATLKPASAAPARSLTPKGPTTQENYGKASPRPTFQDMIKSPYDEELFSFYNTAQLVKNTAGVETKIGQPNIYSVISVSPDKNYCSSARLKNHSHTWYPHRDLLLRYRSAILAEKQ